MTTLAPIVLGYLGKAKATQQPQAEQGGGFLDILTGATKTVNQQPSNQGFFSKMMDKDGDGSMVDDWQKWALNQYSAKYWEVNSYFKHSICL